MKKRDITILLKTLTFSNIKKVDGLMFYETSDGSIILNKGYIYIYIYGFYVENNLYFEVYDLKNRGKSSLRVLLGEISEKGERLKVYEKYRAEYKNSITDILSTNALSAEQDFFVFMEMLSLFIPDIFEYPLPGKYEKYFSLMTEQETIQFKQICGKMSNTM